MAEQTPAVRGKTVGYVEDLWNEWDAARRERQNKLVECYWNTHSEYSAGVQGQWREREATGTGSKIFMGQTADKVRGGYSQASDAIVGMEFDLIPIEIDGMDKEDARERVKKMRQAVDDFLKLGEFGQVLNKGVYTGAWSGLAIWRAPILAEKTEMVFDFNDGGDLVGTKKVTEYAKAATLDPFTFYPDPRADNPQEGDGYIILHRLGPSEVRREARALGWDMAAVDKALKKGSTQDQKGDDWESSKRSAKQETEQTEQNERFDVLEFWGVAKVSDLREYDVEVTDELVGFEVTDDDFVECCLVVSGGEVFKSILNPWYPAPYRPLMTWQWDLQPSNQWGLGVAESMIPEQTVINGGYRLLLDNKGLSSNPMWRIFPNDLEPGQDLTTVFPGKKWLMKDGATGPGIEFVGVPDISDGIFSMIQAMQANAETNTGVVFSPGGDSGTATEAAINQNRLTSTFRARLRRLDEVVEQIIEWYVRWINEVGDPDEYADVKLPVTVKATGILKTALVRELQTLRLQNLIPALQMAMTLPKVGPEGSALEGYDISRVFKHLFRALGVDDVELTDTERQDILLESLGEAGARLREMLDAGDLQGFAAGVADLAGGGAGATAGSVQTPEDAGAGGDVQANAGTANAITGGIGNQQTGTVTGVAS